MQKAAGIEPPTAPTIVYQQSQPRQKYYRFGFAQSVQDKGLNLERVTHHVTSRM
jgi:hypothetical protein